MSTLKSFLFAALRRIPQDWLPLPIKLRLLLRSNVLDYAWYRHTTQQMPATPLELARGVWTDDRERVANALFSADYYRVAYGFKGSPGQALLDYVMRGEAAGRRPCEWFDPVYFRSRHPDVSADDCALALFTRQWQRYPSAHPYFDLEWYLRYYADVAESGRNPLAHFVIDGADEHREPNEFFNSRWYLKQNPDIADSGMSASVHFCLHGATELRNPSPRFDMRRYAARFPHYAQTGLDPLAHYLVHGRAEGLDISRLCLGADEFATPAPPPAVRPLRTDVVIPVYRNVEETRRCLESVLASDLPEGTRVLVYNDCSPEPEVTAYLRARAATGGFVLEENQDNLGFVGTVNRAMQHSLDDGHAQAVVLLNSDTEVANDWLTRLAAHPARDGQIASVTALSNNATICSYPRIGDNPMPADVTLAQLDRICAQVNGGVAIDLPTAVGFCMLIPHAVLRQVGLFDHEAFGKGYGEENDFCLRAAAAGYRNVLAADVFVRHVGEVSFAAGSHAGKQNAARIIRARWPDYDAMVVRHVGADPSLVARCRITFARWAAAGHEVMALVTHDVGGGTQRQVDAVCENTTGRVVVIKPVAGYEDRLLLECHDPYDGFELVVAFDGGEGVARLLAAMGVTRVEIHHLLGHGPSIREGLAISGLQYDFHIHDYFTICPQITLTTADHRYCGEPDAHGCNACIAQRPTHGSSDIANWRLLHDWALLGAQRIISPSHDAAVRMRRYHPIDVEVVQHEAPVDVAIAPVSRGRRPTARDPLRVAMLGALAPHKGKYVVLNFVREIATRQLPVRVQLIGYLGVVEGELDETMSEVVTSTGWYRECERDALIARARPEVFLFASTAPETYSFTLTAAMQTGLPIAAPRHGAFPERLADYPHALLFDRDITAAGLADLLLQSMSASQEVTRAQA